MSILNFKHLTNLNFNLNLMESESKAKIISSPKIITKNNIAANITQSDTSYYADTVTSPATATTPASTSTTWKTQASDMALAVTPQVTNEGSINLKVDVTKGSVGLQSQAGAPKDLTSRKITTEVLVDNGSTIVIGGVYSFSESENHSGIPFLKEIPVFGWLFRSNYNPVVIKKELIIFISPRVINQEEAGLTDKG
jgi:type IV pilus assembly protein PilQ